MTLMRDVREFASWFRRATRRLAVIDRRATLRLIVSMSINQIVTVLVFFLPLKVVLLIASDGVPRYFQFFITQDTRDVWLAGLAAAIFVLYIVTIRLDAIADRSATQGAKSLVNSAEQVPITSDLEDFAKTTFHRIGDTAGGLVFSLLALGLGIAIFPTLFLAIPCLLFLEFVGAALAAENATTTRLGRFGAFVREQPQELLRWLKQINFLIVFALLLALFLVLEGVNPLLAIAAIMLSRRTFGVLKNVARDSLKLSGQRHLVDALLFPDARVQVSLGTDREQLLGSATPSSRLDRLRSLAQAPASDERVEQRTDDPGTLERLRSVESSVWVDSGQNRTAVFDLYGAGADGQPERLFRDYLHSGKAARGLEQHDYLLRFLDAETLRCPSRVLAYRYAGLMGRTVDFRGFTEPEPREWKARRAELLQHLWALEVPASLVAAYDSAHRRLPERLREELLGPLEVAADEPWAQSTYDLLASRLPRLCDRVADLPLMLFNERLTRRNVVADPHGRSCLVDWTSWTLQPVGAGFAPDSDDQELLEAAGRHASLRTAASESATCAVLLAALLQRMDRLVQDGYPKAGLRMASVMLPVLEHPDDVLLEEVFAERASHAAV